MKKIKVFDTTLRDGEQTPHVNFSLEDKVKIAKQLEKLGVDIIEGGFAIASPKNKEALQAISRVVDKTTLCSLARATKGDIDAAYDAIKEANNKCIHTFIATSPVHMKYKLKMSEEEVLKRAVDAVTYAKTLVDEVEFSAEDATRSDKDFLVKIFTAVIKAGATTVNIPDTVGYTIPDEYFKLVSYIIENTEGIDDVTVSVHCHNDLGLATANSLAAVRAGATQIECTINGIGERAGNTALEEVVMALNTRKQFFDEKTTSVVTEQIMKSSKLISYLGGINVQPNKAIVGKNAFSHESGIHQHGVLENPETYEIMDPKTIGIQTNKIILGSLSGRHAFVKRLQDLGIQLDDDNVNTLFVEFKKLADTKEEVYDEDLLVLVNGIDDKTLYNNVKLIKYDTHKEKEKTFGQISLLINGKMIQQEAYGVGPVDALFTAISKIFKEKFRLDKYQLDAITGDTSALANVRVTLSSGDQEYVGRSHSTDIIEASIFSYLNAMLGVAHLEN